MGIDFSLQSRGVMRLATPTTATQASILSSVRLGMAFDTKIARAESACGTQVENSIDQTAFGLKPQGRTIG